MPTSACARASSRASPLRRPPERRPRRVRGALRQRRASHRRTAKPEGEQRLDCLTSELSRSSGVGSLKIRLTRETAILTSGLAGTARSV
eukprot:8614454-Alexandrium_andersonii.AAC.1